MSIANINPETGIRYGTIYLNHLDPDTAAYLFDGGRNVSEDEDEVIEEIREEVNIAAEENGFGTEDDKERWIEREFERRVESLQIEEPTIEGTCDGVEYMISWLGGAPLLWVLKSPHTGRFRLCSPCVPYACDIESPDEDGYEGYTVPADWLPKEV